MTDSGVLLEYWSFGIVLLVFRPWRVSPASAQEMLYLVRDNMYKTKRSLMRLFVYVLPSSLSLFPPCRRCLPLSFRGGKCSKGTPPNMP